MLILIAESKTMSADEREVKMPQFPDGEAGADMISERLAACSVGEISEMLKVSPSLAASCLKMAKEFPFKQTGYRAIDAFTGVVFRAMDAKSFTPEMEAFADKKLLIVSSLYSLLSPSDTIKSYRLDYTSKAAPGDVPMWKWQKEETTERLKERLKEDNNILNLMPGDACKCIEWKAIESIASVVTVNFKEVQPGGETKTPRSNRLKQLRGLIVRQIIEGRLTTIDQLKVLKSDDFLFDPDSSTETVLTFLC